MIAMSKRQANLPSAGDTCPLKHLTFSGLRNLSRVCPILLKSVKTLSYLNKEFRLISGNSSFIPQVGLFFVV